MKYYQKELVSNRLYLRSTGAPVSWEPIGDDQGVLATENDVVINELDQAVARHVGGVIEIDQEQYDSAKKKALGSPLAFNLPRDRSAISGLMFQQPQSLSGLVAATNPAPLHGQLRDIPKEIPEPIRVQTEFQRPATRKGFFKERPDVSK